MFCVFKGLFSVFIFMFRHSKCATFFVVEYICISKTLPLVQSQEIYNMVSDLFL